MKEIIEITDLKDMLKKTGKAFGKRPAYKIKKENGYKIITHKEVREMVDGLGTALINLGLKGKRIAVIGENRYEWEIAYLAITCGTGIVVPLDKSLPENELKRLIERSQVEAIFYTKKYEEILKRILLSNTGKLKHLISMDEEKHTKGIYSEKELIETGKKLIEQGKKEFITAQINSEEMQIMLFTSGTTSEPKVVGLTHKNLCSNLMEIAKALDIDETDRILSFLPIHHVFECTVGFLYSLYVGAQTSFCDGIRHILENLNEYQITFAAFVPAIYENMYKNLMRKLEKEGKYENTLKLMEQHRNDSMEEKKKIFKDIHKIFGGNIKLFVSGAASLDPNVEQGFRDLGINLCQGYGLTETSPVIGVETNKEYKVGSIGKALPNLQVKIIDADKNGMGELVVKGPSIMKGYFENDKATKEVLEDGWFKTGDLATIDEEGYIFIKGRKKSVIVLKNGKNIFPEEMESLVNRIEGVKESFIYGKSNKKDKDDIRIYLKMVIDPETIKNSYKVKSNEEIYETMKKKVKEINKTMPAYKAIRGIKITEEPLIKTTTGKIRRQEEIKTVE